MNQQPALRTMIDAEPPAQSPDQVLAEVRRILEAHHEPMGPSKADTIKALDELLAGAMIEVLYARPFTQPARQQ